MNEQAGREMTFNEFAPLCMERANKWIERNMPEDLSAEPNDTFTMVAMLRNCIHRGMTESPRDWTPCAEGLPDTNDDVYITYEYRGKLIAAIGFMGHSGAWYILEDDDGNEAKVNAIAWQPLPAPYRADKRKTESED